MLISKNSAKKILKKVGAKRVSKPAEIKFTKLLEKYGIEIAKSAIKNAQFLGRKTIKEEDIKEKTF